MTVNEMISSFLIYYDRITSFSAPGYKDSEKLLFLNDAQADLIKDRMFGKNFQPPAFEGNQKRVADLRTLIKVDGLDYNSQDTFGSRQYTIPADFLYPIKAFAGCTRSNHPVVNTTELFECIFIKTEDIGRVTNSTVNRTHFIKPYLSISGQYVNLIVDSFTTNTELNLHYIMKPSVLIAGGACNLPEHTHQEIVDIAVRRALKTIGDPRWETSVAEDKLKTT
jgi:hypothetical protein